MDLRIHIKKYLSSHTRAYCLNLILYNWDYIDDWRCIYTIISRFLKRRHVSIWGALDVVHVDPRSCNGGEKGKEKCDTILSNWNFVVFSFIQLLSWVHNY